MPGRRCAIQPQRSPARPTSTRKRSNWTKILRPELRDCRTICVANKQENDCVYFAGIRFDHVSLLFEIDALPRRPDRFPRREPIEAGPPGVRCRVRLPHGGRQAAWCSRAGTMAHSESLDYLRAEQFMADAAKSRALASAFELGLIDCLAASGPVMFSALRAKLGCDEKGLRMLLRLLASQPGDRAAVTISSVSPLFSMPLCATGTISK